MRYTKLLTIILIISYYPSTYPNPMVILCPTVAEIKNGKYTPWLPLYKEGEELVSDQDLSKVKAHILAFSIAKWSPSYLESGHCFYNGNDHLLDKIIFAQDAWRPKTNNHWNWINTKLAECNSVDVNDCGFIF